MTNEQPWRLADLTFEPAGEGREKAKIDGVVVVRMGERYWISTPNGPYYDNIAEDGVDAALNYLFAEKRSG